jgi:hypothetical protein
MGAAPSSTTATNVTELELRLARAEAALADADARAAADRARAEAALADADARAAADRASAEAANKVAFLRWLDSIAASGSESSPADTVRRHAPVPFPASEDEVLLNCPRLNASDVRSAWSSYTSAHAPSAAVGDTRQFELRAVQPTVARLAGAAAGTKCALRAWHGKVAADAVAAAAMAPDQVWTHARDNAVSTIGALIMFEVKKPDDLDDAVAQAAKYLRRRVAALFHEANARGETGHDIFALAAATDGCRVVFLRMTSGARADGVFPINLQPCPVIATVPLPLLIGWDFVNAEWAPPSAPPAGFTALVRMLRAPPDKLGNELPLASLVVTPEPTGDSVTLDFAARLGCGGTSDVYALRAPAGDRLAGAVAKVPRVATAAVDAQFRREVAALEALTCAGADVPALLWQGARAGTSPAHVGACRWPVLVLTPAGEPLCNYVSRLVMRERAALSSVGTGVATATVAECAERITSARCALADRVVAGVLGVLKLAHERDIIHCDVRPANIVVVGGDSDGDVGGSGSGGAGGGGRGAEGGGLRFLLIDWGACIDAGTNTAGRGVPAFAPSEVYTQHTYEARPALDLTALAHTWLAIAYGTHDASAPWSTAALEPPEQTHKRRKRWLTAHVREAAVVESLFGSRSGVRAGAYAWARGCE